MQSYISNLIKISISASKLNARFYARWAHRRPVKVLTQDEFEAQEETYLKKNDPNKTVASNNIIELHPSNLFENKTSNLKETITENPERKNIKKKEKLFDLERLDAETNFIKNEQDKSVETEKKRIKYATNTISKTTFDNEGNFIYTKMEDNDPKIGTLMLMVKSRKLRDRKEAILIEGKRLIRDALEKGCVLQHLLFSRKADLEYIRDLLPKDNVHLYKVAYRDIQMWSNLTTCPGIMGIFKTPNIENTCISQNSLPLTVICDNIREPGNLGAILRSSVAVGCEKILLTKGCVDIWEPKVLRSSSGAHFKLSVHKNLEWDKIRELLPENVSIFLADNNIMSTKNISEDNLKTLCLNVPVLPYYSINFSNYESIVLIIGGETFGLSEHAYKLAFDNNGLRVNIPLENKIESLNTGTALGILVFELKRQLLLSNKT